MKKRLSLISFCLLAAAAFFVVNADGEYTRVHVSQIDPVILEQASLINCICIRGGGSPAWVDYENMQPDKEGYVFVNSNGYPICLPCENQHQEEDPGN